MESKISSNLLVVEDELGPRESLRLILKPYYNVVTVENGSAAIQVVQQMEFDVITLDLKMPGMSGMSALKEIRKFNSDAMVIIITGFGTLPSAIEAIRYDVFDYIPKPFNVHEIVSIIDKSIQWKKLHLTVKELFGNLYDQNPSNQGLANPDIPLQNRLRRIDHSISDSKRSSNHQSFLDFANALAYTLKEQDPYTLGHLDRVCTYSELISMQLPFSTKERDELQIASFLHDIGKIGISNRLINKKDTLTPTDQVIVKQHAKKSVDILAPLNLSSNILSFIQHHHEHFDGTGYPDGLKGNEIPLGARIIAISDSYDSMISNRPYRKPLPKEEAKNELLRFAKKQFDPDLVSIFLNILEDIEEVFRGRDLSKGLYRFEENFSHIQNSIFMKNVDLPKA
jgi:response regulator RpfG family c-di-GMP phosphodiesterase